jgi:MFS family permease
LDVVPLRVVPLSRNPGFNTYWFGQALSVLGDAFAMVATPLLVLRATGSVVAMGLLTTTAGVGAVLSGLVAGIVVDRADRRKLMVACDTARALLWLSVALVWTLRGPSLPLLFVVSFAASALGNAFQVACITAVRNLVAREQIIAANGRLMASFALMTLVGPMLAGVVCRRYGPALALGLDALSFVCSAVSLLFVRLRREPATAADGGARGRGAAHELLAGVQYLWSQPVLRAITVLLAGSTLILAARNDLLIYLVKHGLRGGDDDVGLVFGVASAGAVAAGLIAARLRASVGFPVSWLGGGFVLSIGLLLVGAAHGLRGVTAATVLIAFADTVRGVNSMTLRQEITPDHLLGRVTAAFWTLINVPIAVGPALATAVAARVGVRATLLGVGAASFALAVAGLFTPIRGFKG